MGLFNIFKKKKVKTGIFYTFNFEKFPELLEIYTEYRKLKSKATSLSMKDVKNDKYEKAAAMRDNYGQNVVAKEIWNIFNSISPTLYNSDKDEYMYYSQTNFISVIAGALQEEIKKRKALEEKINSLI